MAYIKIKVLIYVIENEICCYLMMMMRSRMSWMLLLLWQLKKKVNLFGCNGRWMNNVCNHKLLKNESTQKCFICSCCCRCKYTSINKLYLIKRKSLFIQSKYDCICFCILCNMYKLSLSYDITLNIILFWYWLVGDNYLCVCKKFCILHFITIGIKSRHSSTQI